VTADQSTISTKRSFLNVYDAVIFNCSRQMYVQPNSIFGCHRTEAESGLN
jgi:hypothetical protein